MSTSSSEASHASPSLRPGDGAAPTTNGGSGLPSLTLFADYDPATCSWKMCQESLFPGGMTAADGTPLRSRACWETWPRAGTTRSGTAYLLRPSAPLTSVTAGSRLPIPTATPSGYNRSNSDGAAVRPSLETMARRGLWPTPRVSATRTSRRAAMAAHLRSAPSLEQAVELVEGILPRELESLDEVPDSWARLWPTPRASDGSHAGRVTPRKRREGGSLIEAVAARRWPTPTASLRDADTMDRQRYSGDARRRYREGSGEPYRGATTGQLNPMWVEWLMGLPMGWTDLRDSTGSATP
jgi:hypothetical protein